MPPDHGMRQVLIADAHGFTTFWVLVAIVLYIVVGILAGGGSSDRRSDGRRSWRRPGSHRIAHLRGRRAADAHDGHHHDAADRRVLYLMVLKPTP